MSYNNKSHLCIIVTGGSIQKNQFNQYMQALKPLKPYIIGVDGGCQFMMDQNLSMDLMVGDFDTLKSESLNCLYQQGKTIKQLETMKDVTDTHYALSEACELGYGQIIVFGGTGSRLDHTLANMMVAFNYEGHNMTFIQEHNIVDVCHGQRQYVGPCEQIRKLIIGEYQYLSLIPVESTYIASTTGLKYPIRNQWLKVYDSLGVSNELCDHDYQIEVGDGKLLIVYSRD